MDDLIELLDRTTPSISAPNVGALTRRARVRRARRWAAFVTPLVVLTAGAVALRPASGRHVTTANAPQPIGTWRRTSPPPLDLTSQVRTVTLPDGRLLVVAGSFDFDMPAHQFETALYDANSDHWTRLTSAPIAPHARGADLLAANGQVVLVAHGDSGPVSVALLDSRTLQWRALPTPSQSGHVFDAWAWNGTTLVLARFGDNPYGPHRGSSGSPVLERWSSETNTWRRGASPPTAPRFVAAVARTPHRLAVWGGYTVDPHAPKTVPVPVPVDGTTPTTAGSGIGIVPERAFTDGAIYDIDNDSWTYLPPEPSLAEMATRSAEGLLGASTLTLVSSQVDGSPRIVARYEHGNWRRLASPSAAGAMFAVEQATGTLAIATRNESGPQPAQYIDGTADYWQAAPAYQLARGPGGLLAISATMDGPGKSAFSVWRLDGTTTWTPATAAPFPGRMEPGLGVVGNRLLVIGGRQGPNLEPQHDAWLLDLTPTR